MEDVKGAEEIVEEVTDFHIHKLTVVFDKTKHAYVVRARRPSASASAKADVLQITTPRHNIIQLPVFQGWSTRTQALRSSYQQYGLIHLMKMTENYGSVWAFYNPIKRKCFYLPYYFQDKKVVAESIEKIILSDVVQFALDYDLKVLSTYNHMQACMEVEKDVQAIVDVVPSRKS